MLTPPTPPQHPLTLPGEDATKGCRVFIGNLSWEVTFRELRDHCSQAGVVIRADVLQGGDSRSKGCGIVVFASDSDASNAVQTLHDTELMGRKIFAREDREDENTATRVPKVQVPSSNNGQFNPATAQTRRVYVGNLSWDVAWQDLKVGEVVVVVVVVVGEVVVVVVVVVGKMALLCVLFVLLLCVCVHCCVCVRKTMQQFQN